MATTVDECRQIVDLVKSSGLKYMMMETVVYAREFLFMKELYDKGELGKVQFLKQVTSRIWMDGRIIGRDFLQCIMQLIV
jgi:predicted dehydrogenase